jgi:chloramphenicol-sensitive protein RarD
MGLTPIYWKLLTAVNPLQLLGLRVVSSCLFLLPVLLAPGSRRELAAKWRTDGARSFLLLTLSAALIALSWYLYIVGVAAQRILDCSLAFFLSPLLTVLLGVIVQGERLNRARIVALAGTLVALAVQTRQLGGLPGFVLLLAATLSLYNFLKKRIAMPPTLSVAIESLVLTPVMFVMLARQPSAFAHSAGTWALLALSGPVTALPLIWLSRALKTIRLATAGFLFYLAPTLQFLLAVAFYHEAITLPRLAVFVPIWLALVVFTVDLARAISPAAKAASSPASLSRRT